MTIPLPDSTRPTTQWRTARSAQESAVAAGTLPASEAYLPELFPDAFLDPCDVLLSNFETALSAPNINTPPFTAVYAAIETLVVALNELNEEGEGAYIETDERERLCAWIDEVIEGAGIRVARVAEARGLGVHEITDEWRDW